MTRSSCSTVVKLELQKFNEIIQLPESSVQFTLAGTETARGQESRNDSYIASDVCNVTKFFIESSGRGRHF